MLVCRRIGLIATLGSGLAHVKGRTVGKVLCTLVEAKVAIYVEKSNHRVLFGIGVNAYDIIIDIDVGDVKSSKVGVSNNTQSVSSDLDNKGMLTGIPAGIALGTVPSTCKVFKVGHFGDNNVLTLIAALGLFSLVKGKSTPVECELGNKSLVLIGEFHVIVTGNYHNDNAVLDRNSELEIGGICAGAKAGNVSTVTGTVSVDGDLIGVATKTNLFAFPIACDIVKGNVCATLVSTSGGLGKAESLTKVHSHLTVNKIERTVNVNKVKGLVVCSVNVSNDSYIVAVNGDSGYVEVTEFGMTTCTGTVCIKIKSYNPGLACRNEGVAFSAFPSTCKRCKGKRAGVVTATDVAADVATDVVATLITAANVSAGGVVKAKGSTKVECLLTLDKGKSAVCVSEVKSLVVSAGDVSNDSYVVAVNSDAGNVKVTKLCMVTGTGTVCIKVKGYSPGLACGNEGVAFSSFPSTCKGLESKSLGSCCLKVKRYTIGKSVATHSTNKEIESFALCNLDGSSGLEHHIAHKEVELAVCDIEIGKSILNSKGDSTVRGSNKGVVNVCPFGNVCRDLGALGKNVGSIKGSVGLCNYGLILALFKNVGYSVACHLGTVGKDYKLDVVISVDLKLANLFKAVAIYVSKGDNTVLVNVGSGLNELNSVVHCTVVKVDLNSTVKRALVLGGKYNLNVFAHANEYVSTVKLINGRGSILYYESDVGGNGVALCSKGDGIGACLCSLDNPVLAISGDGDNVGITGGNSRGGRGALRGGSCDSAKGYVYANKGGNAGSLGLFAVNYNRTGKGRGSLLVNAKGKGYALVTTGIGDVVITGGVVTAIDLVGIVDGVTKDLKAAHSVAGNADGVELNLCCVLVGKNDVNCVVRAGKGLDDVAILDLFAGSLVIDLKVKDKEIACLIGVVTVLALANSLVDRKVSGHGGLCIGVGNEYAILLVDEVITLEILGSVNVCVNYYAVLDSKGYGIELYEITVAKLGRLETCEGEGKHTHFFVVVINVVINGLLAIGCIDGVNLRHPLAFAFLSCKLDIIATATHLCEEPYHVNAVRFLNHDVIGV